MNICRRIAIFTCLMAILIAGAFLLAGTGGIEAQAASSSSHRGPSHETKAHVRDHRTKPIVRDHRTKTKKNEGRGR